MYDAILFDLDGTLVDSSEGILNAAKETMMELEMEPLSDEEIRSCIGPPIGETLGKMAGFTESDKKRFYEVFRPAYRDKYLFQCSLYPGMVSLLEDFRGQGLRLGIATNKRDDSTRLLLDYLRIADLFDVVVAQDRNQVRSKSDMILDALLILGIDKNQAVMIGDTQSDLDAAKGAGVNFIGVRYGFGFKESMVSGYEFVDSVDDLRNSLLG